MSREADFATRMSADTTLAAILTGGVYKSESTGIEGINRDMGSPNPFDSDGYLKPTALVRQRAAVPDLQISEFDGAKASYAQVVEIYLYADSGAGYSALDSARDRLIALFHGYKFTDSYPAEWVNTIDRMRDQGALAGAGMARIDFSVRAIRS